MNDMLKDAGRLIGRYGMVWIRRLEAPVAEVWQAVSTTDGLSRWWLGGAPHYTIDLKEGGVFQHHWRSTVSDFKKYEYIDFENESWIGGGMRFELKPEGDATVFSFLVLGEQPSGPAGGWHGGIDALE